jgi:hypothetical protein
LRDIFIAFARTILLTLRSGKNDVTELASPRSAQQTSGEIAANASEFLDEKSGNAEVASNDCAADPGNAAFFKAKPPSSPPNVLTVTFVYCSPKSARSEVDDEEKGKLTFTAHWHPRL